MEKEQMIQVVRLQENLSSVRKIAGWTAEGLGNMLGVSKQNISNIETKKTTLSKAQYIAIRHLVDYQINQNPGNKTLALMVNLLIDHLEIIGHDYLDLCKVAQDIGVSASSMKGKTLDIFATTLLKASYTRFSDFSEISSPIKDALESGSSFRLTALFLPRK